MLGYWHVEKIQFRKHEGTSLPRSWELTLELERQGHTPLFLQVARNIAADIRRGRLRPQTALPGSRSLARILGVHRNTVLSAYAELQAEGWIQTERARGTFVSPSIPDQAPRRFSGRSAKPTGTIAQPGFDLLPAPKFVDQSTPVPGRLALLGGIADVRLVPRQALARAYRRALTRHERELLAYASPQGQLRLRSQVAAMVSMTRALAATAANVMITRGSQMALDLLARSLVSPGDVVAVESLGYRPGWEALRRAGARLMPVPIDHGGLRVDTLESLVAANRVRAIYLTPHHHYPTTVSLAPARRIALLELARRQRIAVIEDDYDHEFHYDGQPLLPLASADTANVVAYVGTLSKVFAPGLRIGYVVAVEPLIERLVAHRAFVDRQGDPAMEWALADLIEEGEVQRHARRVRRIYRARRDAFVDRLRSAVGEVLTFDVPRGGMAIWARADRAIDVDSWAQRGLDRGVLFQTGRHFEFDGRKSQWVRFGFAALDDAEQDEAIRRLRSALD